MRAESASPIPAGMHAWRMDFPEHTPRGELTDTVTPPASKQSRIAALIAGPTRSILAGGMPEVLRRRLFGATTLIRVHVQREADAGQLVRTCA